MFGWLKRMLDPRLQYIAAVREQAMMSPDFRRFARNVAPVTMDAAFEYSWQQHGHRWIQATGGFQAHKELVAEGFASVAEFFEIMITGNSTKPK
jgi:hypothetical protein